MALTLCNSHSRLISAAIMFYSPETCSGDGGDFELMGWWNIAPGSCTVVYENDLEDLNRFWYIFADSPDGTTWAGPFVRNVPTGAFGLCWGIGTSAPGPNQTIGFREFDIGDNDDITVTFVG